MKTISIDIETYSGTDLNKCGVYKYTEDPDFEVLLFGYAVDGGEVHVVDLALGEKIPADISASLTDENVLDVYKRQPVSLTKYHGLLLDRSRT